MIAAAQDAVFCETRTTEDLLDRCLTDVESTGELNRVTHAITILAYNYRPILIGEFRMW